MPSSTDYKRRSPVSNWAHNFIHKIDFSSSQNVLDIGCRKGEISAFLAHHFNQLNFLAIDHCSKSIQMAKDQHTYPNLIFECQNPESFDISNKYDTAISFSCLHWIKNKFNVLKNVYQALTPGGKAYLQLFVLHGNPKNDRFLYQTASTPKWKSYFNGFRPGYAEVTLSEFSALLQNIGFMIHRIEFQKYRSAFEHPEHFHQWLSTWATHKNYIPKHKRDHYIAETVNAYLNAHQYSLNDRFPYFEYLLEVICEKPLETREIGQRISQDYAHINFTPREIFVLQHYLRGKSSKEISSVALVSAKAVEFHIANIKRKLNCHKRSDIYQAALDYGFINLMFFDSNFS